MVTQDETLLTQMQLVSCRVVYCAAALCCFFLDSRRRKKNCYVITSLAWQLLTNQMPRPASVAALSVACSVPTWAAVQLCVVSLKVAAAATTLRIALRGIG